MTGTRDEIWFDTVSVLVEVEGGAALKPLIEAMQAVREDDVETVVQKLGLALPQLRKAGKALCKFFFLSFSPSSVQVISTYRLTAAAPFFINFCCEHKNNTCTRTQTSPTQQLECLKNAILPCFIGRSESFWQARKTMPV